jgi:hypothetical protein
MALLPGESADEFEKLHRDLIAEFAPAGALEDDIVATMAGFLWRKQNLASFQIAKEAQEHYFQIRREKGVDQTYIVGVKERDPKAVDAARQAAVEQARKDLGWRFEFIEIGGIATTDRLTKEIDVQDRLDAMIDKCLKRLLFVRGLKSISPASHAAQPTPIPAPPKAA